MQKRPATIPLLLILAAAWIAAAPPAPGQSTWVDWTEDTQARIQLATVPLNDGQEKDVAVGDLDRDGDDDIVIVRKAPFSNPGGRPNVLLMNQNGVLVDRTTDLMPGFLIADDARDVLIFDANGDAWPDVVVATTFGDQPRLFINQGSAGNGSWLGFQESLNWFSPLFNPGPKFCAVYDGDVDNDGDKDLFFSDYDSPLEDRLLINDGSGVFTDETATRFPTGINQSLFGTGSFVCDFNDDGWNDIIRSSGMQEPISILINDRTGHFTQMQILPSTTVYMIRTADWNNDGRLDVYVVSDRIVDMA